MTLHAMLSMTGRTTSLCICTHNQSYSSRLYVLESSKKRVIPDNVDRRLCRIPLILITQGEL